MTDSITLQKDTMNCFQLCGVHAEETEIMRIQIAGCETLRGTVHNHGRGRVIISYACEVVNENENAGNAC